MLDFVEVTTHNYGMNTSKHRTSFALDDETIRILLQLAERWRVSQAEVVRRVVRRAADEEQTDAQRLLDGLSGYRERKLLSPDEADRYLGVVAAERAGWERGT